MQKILLTFHYKFVIFNVVISIYNYEKIDFVPLARKEETLLERLSQLQQIVTFCKKSHRDISWKK